MVEFRKVSKDGLLLGEPKILEELDKGHEIKESIKQRNRFVFDENDNVVAGYDPENFRAEEVIIAAKGKFPKEE